MSIVVIGRSLCKVHDCQIQPGEPLAEVTLAEGVTLGALADAIAKGLAGEQVKKPAAKPTKKKKVSRK